MFQRILPDFSEVQIFVRNSQNKAMNLLKIIEMFFEIFNLN